mmetsp:Transcript_41734/g.88932  ORF Transcript_41734/g.88932 Transcript_41734/m.88932 type:complete len:218 (-) Transcript_41734:450-1103(-)
MFLMVLTASAEKSGCSSMSRTMVGTPVNLVIPSFWMTFRAAPASHLRCMNSCVPLGMLHRKTTPRAVMWKRGTANNVLGSLSGRVAPSSSPSFMLVPTLRCVCTTPFGKPVLPDVYMIIASSSGVIPSVETRGLPLPAAMRSSQSAEAPSSCAMAASPRHRTAWAPRPARKGWTSFRRSGSPMTTLQPESLMAYSNSAVPQSAFRGTATQPAAVIPR